eukprot:gene32981-42675_t
MSAKGKEILTDLKRSDWLPPYDEEGVTEILKDIVEVHSSLSEALGYERREENEKNINEEDPLHTLTDSEKLLQSPYGENPRVEVGFGQPDL